MADQTMWAIKLPNGTLASVRRTQAGAKRSICDATALKLKQWPELQKKGYRCVRVLVTEILP